MKMLTPDKFQYLNQEKLIKDGSYCKLLEAGIELFADYGYEATSIRQIASLSNTNLSNIKYHFESKEGLYKAVIEYICFKFSGFARESFLDLDNLLENVSKKNAIEAINKICCGLLSAFLENDETLLWYRIIIREQTNPTDAFDIIYESSIKPKQMLLAKLVGIVLKKDSESDYVKLKVHMMVGQVVIFMSGREIILRRLKQKKITKIQINEIKELMLEHVQALLR